MGAIPGIKNGKEEIKVPGGDIPEDHWLLLGKPLASENGRIALKEVAVYAVENAFSLSHPSNEYGMWINVADTHQKVDVFGREVEVRVHGIYISRSWRCQARV